MKMKSRKGLSILLAFVLVLAMSATSAFAAWPSFQNDADNNGIIDVQPAITTPSTVTEYELPVTTTPNVDIFSGVDVPPVMDDADGAYTLYNGGVYDPSSTDGGARLAGVDVTVTSGSPIAPAWDYSLDARANNVQQLSTPYLDASGEENVLYAATTYLTNELSGATLAGWTDAMYTITITADTNDGKNAIATVPFYINGHANSSAAIRALDTPLEMTTANATGKMQFRVNATANVGGLLGVEVIIDGQSVKKTLGEITIEETQLADSGVFQYITIKNANNDDKKVYLYFNNTSQTMTGLMTDKNIIIKFLYDSASFGADSSSKITSISSDNNMGGVQAVWERDDENGSTYTLIATPKTEYGVDKWQYTTDIDVTHENQESKSWTDVLGSQYKQTITETITENRIYRAVFAEAKIVFPGDAVLSGTYEYVLASNAYKNGRVSYLSYGANLPAGESVLEGMPAVLYLNMETQKALSSTEAASITISVYAGDVSTAPYGDEMPLVTYGLAKGGWPANYTNVIAVYIPQLPNESGLTVEAKVGDGGPVSRRYFELPITEDALKTDRAAAHASLDGFRTEYDKLENFKWRYLIGYTLEDAAERIRKAETGAAITQLVTDTENKIKSFINGTAVPGTDYIVGSVHIIDTLPPTLVRIPRGLISVEVVGIALEKEYPAEGDTGTWFIDSFNGFINAFGVDPERKKSGFINTYGGYAGGATYRVNGFFSNVGAFGWPLSDGEEISWGGNSLGNGTDMNYSASWELAVLRDYYTDEYIRDNFLTYPAGSRYYVFADEYKNNPTVLMAKVGELDSDEKRVSEINNLIINKPLPKEFIEDEAVKAALSTLNALDNNAGEAQLQAGRAAYNAIPDTFWNKQYSQYLFKTYEPYKSAYDNLLAQEVRLGGGPINVVPYTTALESALDYIKKNTIPVVGSEDGEWAVLSLARGGMMAEQFKSTYLAALNAALSGGTGADNTISKTDKERIILALSALGIDAANYNDTNLVQSMDNTDHTADTLNGDIYALLALNSKPYDSEKIGTITEGYDEQFNEIEIISEGYIKTILDAQTEGGWGLDGDSSPSVDMTAMAIQALAPYYQTSTTVHTAIEEALAWLQDQQSTRGGFAGWNNTPENSTCSDAQVVIALTALGIDPTNWEQPGGRNPLTALLENYNEDNNWFGEGNTDKDTMATEQAAYALVAYDRFLHGENTLYNMSDAFAPKSSDADVESITVSYGTGGTSSMVATKGEDNTFNVTLPYGTTLPTDPENIIIQKAHRWASISELVSEGNKGEVWTFTITAQDGTSQTYTLIVTTAANPNADNAADVVAALDIINNLSWTVPMATANNQQQVQIWAANILDDLELDGVNATATVNSVTPATAGTADKKDGTGGSFALTVNLTKGEGENLATDSAEVTGVISATKYISSNTGVSSVTVNDKAGIINGTTITVVLDYAEDAVLPTTPFAISIDTYDTDAEVLGLSTEDDGETWTFTVTAEDGETTEDYTIYVSIAADPAAGAQATVDAVKSAIDNDSYSVSMDIANTEEGVKNWLENRIAAYPSVQGQDVTVTAAVYSFEPAVAGDFETPSGINGSFNFTVDLEKEYSIETVTDYVYGSTTGSAIIIAIPYNLSADKGIAAIKMNGTEATASSTYEYIVVLPYDDEAELPTEAEALEITLNSEQATYSTPITTDDGATWTFTVTAEDDSTANYTVHVSIGTNPAADDNAADIDDVKNTIAHSDWDVDMDRANTEQTVKVWVETKLAGLDLQDVQAEVEMGVVTPAVAGTSANTDGTDGSFSFTVNLNKGQGPTLATGSIEVTGTIIATPFTGGGVKPDTNIRVTFRLIGATKAESNIDLKSNKDWKGSEYQTWIRTTSYSMPAGSTMYDLFVKALDDAGLSSSGASNNYVKSINAPSALGGYKLSEFTNGKYSGWMYMVDGKHPGVGLKSYKISDGDTVIWHYVNDYRYEVNDWFDDPSYPALGDRDTWNTWLTAPDVNPSKGGPTGGNPGGAITPPPATGTNIEPKVTAKDGVAEVTINQTTINTTIAEAKKNNQSTIVITPNITGEAQKVSVQLPKTSISSMVSETDATLKVETPVGTINIPQDALTAIATQASGSTVTMSLESVDKSSLTQTQQEMVGDKPVYDISIMSGSSHISSFNGKSITISLPYTLQQGESADSVKVWYLNDAGELEQMDCSYDEKTGLATFKTDHLSYYLVGVEVPGEVKKDDFINPFTDVKESDWFYEAVKFAVENSLFKGTGETTFSPNEVMTRAMLVTVLHRLEGLPETTGANNFTDVKNGQWYTKAVLWANVNDIVGGYGNGLFGTNDPVTREQMAAILYRYASYKGYDVTAEANLSTYTDAPDISSWAKKSMSWANAEGLITGRTATTLAPVGNGTRAEVATILNRFVEGFVK